MEVYPGVEVDVYPGVEVEVEVFLGSHSRLRSHLSIYTGKALEKH